ncbi:MAG: hypothetical protein BAA02_10665 [Paenibacillaceae bacterium ZCTH02-B3]|nr:MAG: hypothetical protein BAA02_10665 [Paenibacillaceae bacterium ZCTH02-B3]
MEYTKPLPKPDVWSRPFWEHAKNGVLATQACVKCGHRFFPPGPVCPSCYSFELEWKPVSGKGKVVSWVVFHQLYYKGFADEIPYNVALVQLDEGPMMYTNIVGIPNEQISMNMPVEVVFEKATDEFTIPKFKPQAGG